MGDLQSMQIDVSVTANLSSSRLLIVTAEYVKEQWQLMSIHWFFRLWAKEKGKRVSTERPLWLKSYRNLVPSARSFRPVVH